MAGIDKTYINDWNLYLDFIKWAKEYGKFVNPDGSVCNIMKSVYNWWTKEDFDNALERGTTIPILNTDMVTDYYLIKYCPFKFVQDRLLDVYSEKYINDIKNGVSKWDNFSKDELCGTHCKAIQIPKYEKCKVNRPYKGVWWIQLDTPKAYSYLDYDHAADVWCWPTELHSCVNGCSNTAHVNTIKALKRKIRKWKLPKGTIVRALGYFVEEEWKFVVY